MRITNDLEQAKIEINRLKSYYPFRYIGYIELEEGVYEIISGKTMARFNNAARKGFKVFYI